MVPPRKRRNLVPHLGLALVVLLAASGCQSGPFGVVRRWSQSRDSTLAHPITDEELGDKRNALAKVVNPGGASMNASNPNSLRRAISTSKPDAETERMIQAAEALYHQGKLAEAELAFAEIDRTKNVYTPEDAPVLADPNAKTTAWTKVKQGAHDFFNGKTKKAQAAWGENVLFLLAECQYQQGKLVAADESYQKVWNNYPATPHMDTITKRQFDIATIWMDSGDATARPEKPASYLDHFNGRLPLIDADGYAIKTLEHVRIQDPNGPLADDAAIKIADHYMKIADYENAAAYYDELRTSMPKSSLIHRAQLGSIEAKVKGYNGPEYDGAKLEEARVTIREALNSAPDRNDDEVKDLYHKLDLIADQQAENAFVHGQFYKRTGYVSGAEYYFGQVRSNYPQSKWAEKARVELASLAKAPRKVATPSKILTLPGASDPNAMGNSMGAQSTMPGAMGGLGGMGGGGGGMPTGQ